MANSTAGRASRDGSSSRRPVRHDPRGQAIPYLGEGTLKRAATFLDPRTGEVVGQVEVGDTVEGAIFGVSVAVSPDRRFGRRHLGPGRSPSSTRGPATSSSGSTCRTESCGRRSGRGDGSRLLLGHETPAARPAPAAGDLAGRGHATWEVVEPARVWTSSPEFMELGPDGRSLAVASGNSPEVVILDATTSGGTAPGVLGVDDRFWDLSFSADGRLLAAAGGLGHAARRRHSTPGRRARDRFPARRSTLQIGVAAGRPDGRLHRRRRDRRALRRRARAASGGAAAGVWRHRPRATPTWCPGRATNSSLFNDDRAGLRYPMDPSVWLREACARCRTGPDARPSGTSTCRAGPGSRPAPISAETAPAAPGRAAGGGGSGSAAVQHSDRGTRAAYRPREKTPDVRTKPGSGRTRTHCVGLGSPSKGMAAAGPAAARRLAAAAAVTAERTVARRMMRGTGHDRCLLG